MDCGGHGGVRWTRPCSSAAHNAGAEDGNPIGSTAAETWNESTCRCGGLRQLIRAE